MIIACGEGKIKLVLELSGSRAELDYEARRGAIDMAVPLCTNVEQALLMAEALEKYGETEGVVPGGKFREGDIPEVETYDELMDLAK